MAKPMERLNAYSRKVQGGGISVDIEGMAVDLVTVCKAGGMSGHTFRDLMLELWTKVEVEVTIPKSQQN